MERLTNDELIKALRQWEIGCDRTNFGCQAKPTLAAAANAIESLQEKLERDKMRCENCCAYNNQLCPISRCYNNDPKNGYRTPFEKKDFCSYFNAKLEE